MNKQKFLAELGRLLTFMYEEDRLHALELYDDIFEEIGNENAVLQLLVSPTRQAVNLARAYDAKERRYQEEGEAPAYVQVIEDIRAQALSTLAPAPRHEQPSIYPQRTQEPEEDIFGSFGFHTDPAPAGRHEQPTYVPFPDEDRDSDFVPSPPPPVIVPPEPEAPQKEVEHFSDSVDAFLADFKIKDDVLKEEAAAVPVTPVEPEAPEKPAEADGLTWEMPAPEPKKAAPDPALSWDLPDEDQATAPAAPRESPATPTAVLTQEPSPKKETPPEEETPPKKETPPSRRKVNYNELPDLDVPDKTPRRKANVPLLILFILLAVPVGLCLAALILAAAGSVLGLSGAALWTGFNGLAMAFSFSVFADFLLVFGMGLACAALGILLLWLFIWLLGGAIPGLVRGLCSLGRKLCYKEVAA